MGHGRRHGRAVGWRRSQAKLLAHRSDFENAERLAREAVEMVAPTDFLDLHARALEDLAEVLRLAGPHRNHWPSSSTRRSPRAEGQPLSAARARALLESLRRTTATHTEEHLWQTRRYRIPFGLPIRDRRGIKLSIEGTVTAEKRRFCDGRTWDRSRAANGAANTRVTVMVTEVHNSMKRWASYPTPAACSAGALAAGVRGREEGRPAGWRAFQWSLAVVGLAGARGSARSRVLVRPPCSGRSRTRPKPRVCFSSQERFLVTVLSPTSTRMSEPEAPVAVLLCTSRLPPTPFPAATAGVFETAARHLIVCGSSRLPSTELG